MVTPIWQLKSPINTIIFDCDGTLSTIEGIDHLAEKNQIADKVKALTADAMTFTGLRPALYRQRLNLVLPKKADVLALGQEYLLHQTEDAADVIQAFKSLRKHIYIISAGLDPAVKIFGELLGVSRENIFAVGIQFDAEGNYADFDERSPLADREGKRDFVKQIKAKHGEAIFVGDGMNDLAVYDLIERFIGYGGEYYRENIASKCQFYIRTRSMASLLALALTAVEAGKLASESREIYENGLRDIQEGRVIIR